jgi:hypothetical protein
VELLFVIMFIGKIGVINLFKNESFILIPPLNSNEPQNANVFMGGKLRHFDIAIGKGNVKIDGIING